MYNEARAGRRRYYEIVRAINSVAPQKRRNHDKFRTSENGK